MAPTSSAGAAAAAAWLCLGFPSAFAHHSLSPYDRDVLHSVEGVVQAYDFANPHVKLSLRVSHADGSSREWLFESSSVSRMAARGFNRVSTRPGDTITVRFNPRRDGSSGGYLTGFTDSRGRSFGPVQER
jgi:Family of unknown function (DUF6152)